MQLEAKALGKLYGISPDDENYFKPPKRRTLRMVILDVLDKILRMLPVVLIGWLLYTSDVYKRQGRLLGVQRGWVVYAWAAWGVSGRALGS